MNGTGGGATYRDLSSRRVGYYRLLSPSIGYREVTGGYCELPTGYLGVTREEGSSPDQWAMGNGRTMAEKEISDYKFQIAWRSA